MIASSGRPEPATKVGGGLPDAEATECLLQAFSRVEYPAPPAPVRVRYTVALGGS